MPLRVACPGDSSASLVRALGNEWAQRQGVKLEVISYPPDGLPPEEADLWIITPPELGRWAAAGKLRPVPDSYLSPDGSYGWRGLLPIYRDPLLSWGRKPYALPLLGESPLCFYRTDLFRDLEKENPKKLAPPQTWEDLVEAAELSSRRQRDKPVLPPLPEGDDELDRLFYSVAASSARQAVRKDDPKPPPDVEVFSFHYDLATGAARIDKPGFVHALKLLQRLQKVRKPGTHPEPAQAFADGDALFCLADASWIERFEKGKVRGKYGICPVPGGRVYFAYASGEPQLVSGVSRVPYLGSAGWLGVVPTKSSRHETAFALIAHLGGKEASRQVVLDPKWGGAFRHDQLETTGWYSFGLDRAETLNLVDALRQTLEHPSLKNPALRLRTPGEREHLRELIEELRPALLESRDAAATMAAVARRWDKLDETKDPKARRNEYLLNIGFQGDR
jgi:multiple sugar transport system substrate-binding protein